MRKITKIIIHCAATHPHMDIGVAEIRPWHVEGNGWSDIGYHNVFRRNGVLEEGRPLERMGAHTRGYNKNSIGICLVGGHGSSAEDQFEDHFTPLQREALVKFLRQAKQDYPDATIHGHNEFAAKACPGFHVGEFIKGINL